MMAEYDIAVLHAVAAALATGVNKCHSPHPHSHQRRWGTRTCMASVVGASCTHWVWTHLLWFEALWTTLRPASICSDYGTRHHQMMPPLVLLELCACLSLFVVSLGYFHSVAQRILPIFLDWNLREAHSALLITYLVERRSLDWMMTWKMTRGLVGLVLFLNWVVVVMTILLSML